jgi:hypothetical protein
MTGEERYLFDLRGYLVIREALTKEMLRRILDRINYLETLGDDEFSSIGAPRSYREGESLYAKTGRPLEDGLPDYDSRALPLGAPFEELVDWPKTMSYVESLIDDPIRLDAASYMSRNPGGGFRYHHGYAELLPYCEFAYDHSGFHCVSVKVAYALTDVGIEDGAFAVIPGSHKSSFANPYVGQIPDSRNPLTETIPCRAGDAILFTEDLSHGAVENRGQNVRRTLFYSYAPAFHCRWPHLDQTAPDFRERASTRQVELVVGPPRFEPSPT